MSTSSSRWPGRTAAIAITAFVVGVLVLMYFAARGPR